MLLPTIQDVTSEEESEPILKAPHLYEHRMCASLPLVHFIFYLPSILMTNMHPVRLR